MTYKEVLESVESRLERPTYANYVNTDTGPFNVERSTNSFGTGQVPTGTSGGAITFEMINQYMRNVWGPAIIEQMNTRNVLWECLADYYEPIDPDLEVDDVF